jgi:serine protease Do
MGITGFGEVAEKLRRSTVLIHAEGRGSGSGVVWSSDGVIVTNAHVARGGHNVIQLWDGREFRARTISRDSRRDLIALRIDASNLHAAACADSSEVRPGELALAIGNPMGFIGALTTGVIHAIGPVRGLGPRTWVQAGVRLAPGNSGGPLADAHGRVIGINTMVAGRLALAIPSNAVQDFLCSGPSGAWLGVTVSRVTVPNSNLSGNDRQRFGLVVLEVEPDSPASTASLLPGDILLGTDEKSFTSTADLSQILKGSGARIVRLEFLRGDYSQVRRVNALLGGQNDKRSPVAA